MIKCCNPITIKKKQIKFFLYAFFFFTIVSNTFSQAKNQLNENFYLNLNGKWEFFNLDNKDLSNPDFIPQNNINYLQMPGRLFKQKKIEHTGFLWLRKIFYLDRIPQEVLGIYLGEIKSIDETYINGFLIGKTGKMPPEENQAYDVRRNYLIPPSFLKKGENLISIRIYEPPPQNHAGIEAADIYISDFQQIQKADFVKNFIDGLIALASFVVGTYFLILYKSFRKYKETLYFGLTSCAIGLYIFFYENTKYLFFDLNSFDFILLKKIEYFFLFNVPIFYTLFVYRLFSLKHNLYIKIYVFAGILLHIAVFLSPATYYMVGVLRVWQVYLFIAFIYGFLNHIYNFNKEKKDTIFLLGANILLTIFSFIDVGGTLHLHNLPKLLPYGTAFYTFVITIVINYRLKNINTFISNQYKNLVYLTESQFEIIDFLQLGKNYYNYLLTRLRLKKFCVSVSDAHGNNYNFFTEEKWMMMAPKIQNIYIENNELIITKENNFQELSLKQEKILFFPLISENIKRGYILISWKPKDDEEYILHILRILKIEIGSHITRLDYKVNLEQINAELEQRVKERTKEIQQKNLELKRLNEMKTNFFTNISHDIKTPLSLMTIPLDSLLNQGDNINEEQKRSIENIKYNTYKIITMINSLLDAAKLESKKTDVNFVFDDIAQFIKRISEIFRDIILKKNMKFILNIPETPIHTLFDPEKIEKIINNLISNAIKHNLPNKAIIIRLEETDKNHYEIEVKDFGNGIPKKYLSNIFHKFWQFLDDKGISQTGSGLGLSIVKEFTKLHKGKITVESEVNKYTRFILKMPVLKKEKTNYNMVQAPNNFYLSYQQKEKLYADIKNELNLKQKKTSIVTTSILHKIFVLNSTSEIKILLEKVLVNYYSLTFIKEEKKYYSLSKTRLPDIILLYFEKIENKSLLLISKLKNNPDLKYMPFIVISPDTKSISTRNTLSMGIDEFITIPFHPEELTIKMQNLIEQKELRLELKKKYQELNNQLNLTKKLQENFLPKPIELRPQWNFKYHFDPMHQLGGDFFHLVKLKDNSLSGIIFDVSGHGVAPAIITLMSRAFLENSMYETGQNPALLLSLLNEQIYKTFSKYFATAFAFHVAADKKLITFSNAGHLPAILFNKDKLTEITNKGRLLGAFQGNFWKNDEVKLNETSWKLFLYTDGIIEARPSQNDNTETFGLHRLKTFIKENGKKKNLIPLLTKSIKNYKGLRTQSEDDMTFLCIN
ncbi:MAG: SpoIIE family protein phosphatase [Spirochaetia bacterium]|nr:SpoIIE family protein phosphatase [Spirochaetia bacterium]